TAAGEDDLTWAEGVLGAVGVVVRVAEPLLDAVTGLSGSGPAYVFLVAEALVEAGVLVGLPRPVSHTLAVQTLLGSARLLAESGARPRFLTVAEVASMLRVSTMTVYRLIKAGQLPAARVGKSYRVREEDVDSYLASSYTQAG